MPPATWRSALGARDPGRRPCARMPGHIPLWEKGLSIPVLVNLICSSTHSPKSHTDKAPKASGRRLVGLAPASPHPHPARSGSEARAWPCRAGQTPCTSCSGAGVREAALHQGQELRAAGRAEMHIMGALPFKGSQWFRLSPEGADPVLLGSGLWCCSGARSASPPHFQLPKARSWPPRGQSSVQGSPQGYAPSQGFRLTECPFWQMSAARRMDDSGASFPGPLHCKHPTTVLADQA